MKPLQPLCACYRWPGSPSKPICSRKTMRINARTPSVDSRHPHVCRYFCASRVYRLSMHGGHWRPARFRTHSFNPPGRLAASRIPSACRRACLADFCCLFGRMGKGPRACVERARMSKEQPSLSPPPSRTARAFESPARTHPERDRCS